MSSGKNTIITNQNRMEIHFILLPDRILVTLAVNYIFLKMLHPRLVC